MFMLSDTFVWTMVPSPSLSLCPRSSLLPGRGGRYERELLQCSSVGPKSSLDDFSVDRCLLLAPGVRFDPAAVAASSISLGDKDKEPRVDTHGGSVFEVRLDTHPGEVTFFLDGAMLCRVASRGALALGAARPRTPAHAHTPMYAGSPDIKWFQ